jgi:hypothetical protein
LSVEEKFKLAREIENGRKKADLCGAYGFVNNTTKNIWKNRTKIISVIEQNGSRIMFCRKSERSDVDQALQKSFKHQTSDNVPVSGLLLAIILVLPEF